MKSKTLIDNIFLNSLEYVSSGGNLLYEISDHLMQFLILEGYVKERALPETNLFKRDYSNYSDREFFETVINGNDWDEVCMLHYNNGSASFKSFFDRIKFT